MTNQPSTPQQTVVITGGNAGLGYGCADSILNDSSHGKSLHVILACRDEVRGNEAVTRLRSKSEQSTAQVEAMSLDLASLASVRSFADQLGRRLDAGDLPPLHGIICNAGMNGGAKETFTKDGFESTFGVNHLGHFLLVNELLPRIVPPARVIVVSSGTHDPAQKTPVPVPAWNDPLLLAKGELGPAAAKDSPSNLGQRRYSTSKLANIIYTYELARRLPSGVTANAFDPGLMPGTGLMREAPAPIQFLWHRVLPRVLWVLRRVLSPNIHTPAESGAALAHLMVAPELAGISGKYFEGTREISSSCESYEIPCGGELWRASELLTTKK